MDNTNFWWKSKKLVEKFESEVSQDHHVLLAKDMQCGRYDTSRELFMSKYETLGLKISLSNVAALTFTVWETFLAIC